METIIDIAGVSASYGSREIIHNVSLKIEEGGFIVLIGPSGCGKTTLLKMINGLITPDSGEVSVCGQSLKQCDIIALRRQIGYAVQGVKLFPHLTVEENICYVPSIARGKEQGRLTGEEKRRLAREMLELVQLPPELAERFPAQLSGGQQQRAGIARALAARPKILLMDEPFGAVDEITRKGLQDELLDLRHKMNITVVFITHDINEALKLADRIVVMRDGIIVQDGTPVQVREQPADDFVKQLLGVKDLD